MSLTHVVAISIADRHPDNDAMDTIASFCTDLVHPLGRAGQATLGSGGITDRDGMAVWRVSSVRDLGARLYHLPDRSLERFDLVAHSKVNGDALDVRVGTEWLSESLGLRAMYLLREKLARRPGDLFSPPLVRVVSCKCGLNEPLLRGLARALRGVTVMATRGEPCDYDPKMIVSATKTARGSAPFRLRPPREWSVVRYVKGGYEIADGWGLHPLVDAGAVDRWHRAYEKRRGTRDDTEENLSPRPEPRSGHDRQLPVAPGEGDVDRR